MREELQYTPGYWWHRKGTDVFFRNALLGQWDSASNYEQVTDEQYEAAQAELTDSEALQIIVGNE